MIMIEKENKVSIALCTYNGSAYLGRQLDSILSQTYPIDEIIIVDDCSTDSTRDILDDYRLKFDKIKLYLNENNLGSNEAFKYAISLTSNEYIALSDQDDIWHKDKIEVQMKSITDNGYDHSNKPLLSFHDLCLIDQNDGIIYESFWKLHKFDASNFNFRKLLISNIVTGCTCIINKNMKDELIRCDMKDIIMHDYLIALIGYGFGNYDYVNKQLMYYRSHSNSVTEKERITMGNRITSFISRVQNGNYLMPNILQIKKFNYLYGKNLDIPKSRLVARFIKLDKSNVVTRMIYKWLLN